MLRFMLFVYVSMADVGKSLTWVLAVKVGDK
jgi:hypothetical protein